MASNSVKIELPQEISHIIARLRGPAVACTRLDCVWNERTQAEAIGCMATSILVGDDGCHTYTSWADVAEAQKARHAVEDDA